MAEFKDLLGEIAAGSIWSTPPVSEQPKVTLARWRVVEVYTKKAQVERHFIGYNVEDQEGRVSSAIQNFDPKVAQGTTRSGRVYELIGEPGRDPDGEYVWENWARIKQFTDEKDVTTEYVKLLAMENQGEDDSAG